MKTLTLTLIMLLNMNLFAGDPCKGIRRSVDKFTGEIKYVSTFNVMYGFGAPDGVNFTKVIASDGSEVTYLYAQTRGITLTVEGKESIILFEGGEKIVLEAEVEANAMSGSEWKYTIFARLTNEQMKLIAEKPMTDVRLYIFDFSVSGAKRYMRYMSCLLTKHE